VNSRVGFGDKSQPGGQLAVLEFHDFVREGQMVGVPVAWLGDISAAVAGRTGPVPEVRWKLGPWTWERGQ
jgi:hypothetical protein